MENNKGERIKIEENGLIPASESGKYAKNHNNWIDPTSEHFQIWMQIDPLVPIKKLYGVINDKLEGNYTMVIANSKI